MKAARGRDPGDAVRYPIKLLRWKLAELESIEDAMNLSQMRHQSGAVGWEDLLRQKEELAEALALLDEQARRCAARAS